MNAGPPSSQRSYKPVTIRDAERDDQRNQWTGCLLGISVGLVVLLICAVLSNFFLGIVFGGCAVFGVAIIHEAIFAKTKVITPQEIAAAVDEVRASQRQQIESLAATRSLSCKRCNALSAPIPGTVDRYRCVNCGRQFVSSRHGIDSALSDANSPYVFVSGVIEAAIEQIQLPDPVNVYSEVVEQLRTQRKARG